MSAAVRHGPGPKSTPAFANGRLFSLGMTNIVTAFDAATGKQLWQKPATKAQPLYHTAMSPVVEGNSVIVHTGGQGETALAALDVATGNPRWTLDRRQPGLRVAHRGRPRGNTAGRHLHAPEHGGHLGRRRAAALAASVRHASRTRRRRRRSLPRHGHPGRAAGTASRRSASPGPTADGRPKTSGRRRTSRST